MSDRTNDAAPREHGDLEPHPDVLAEIDRLGETCKTAPDDIDSQIRLWTAVAALDQWFCINRGTSEQPRPYSLAAEAGTTLCVFSSAARARASAQANGLIAEGAPISLFVVPMPAALDWAMSFSEHGVIGVTIDYPQIGVWCPLPNLARLRDMRLQS